jgi:hypothetical protein
MYDGNCPRCANAAGFSERGLKHWTVTRTDADGHSCEAVVATDYYWTCDSCGKAFGEHVTALEGIEHAHRSRDPSQNSDPTTTTGAASQSDKEPESASIPTSPHLPSAKRSMFTDSAACPSDQRDVDDHLTDCPGPLDHPPIFAGVRSITCLNRKTSSAPAARPRQSACG